MALEPLTIVETLEVLRTGTATYIQQDQSQASYYLNKRTPDDSVLDAARPLSELFDAVGACNPGGFSTDSELGLVCVDSGPKQIPPRAIDRIEAGILQPLEMLHHCRVMIMLLLVFHPGIPLGLLQTCGEGLVLPSPDMHAIHMIRCTAKLVGKGKNPTDR